MEQPTITIKFTGGALRVPTSLVPDHSTLIDLIDGEREHSVELDASSIVTTQETLDKVSQLLLTGSSVDITDDQWLSVSRIADLLNISQLHDAVIDHYTLWHSADPERIAKYYDHGVIDVDVQLARRALNDDTIGTPEQVLRLAQSSKPIWVTTPIGGHSAHVTCLKTLHDGRLASASFDSTIKIWDTTTYTCCATLIGHREVVNSLAPLSKTLLASGSADHTIKIWNTCSRTCVATLKGHANRVTWVENLCDGRVASASEDCSIKIWDVASAKCTATLHDAGPYAVDSLALLPDGRLASAGFNPQILLWDTNTGACTVRLVGHTGTVICMTVLPNGRLVSLSFMDNSIRVWNTEDASRCQIIMGGGDAYPCQIKALPDGFLASMFTDGTITVWDLTDIPRVHMQVACGSTTELIRMCNIEVLPGGRLVSVSAIKCINFWDAKTMSVFASMPVLHDCVSALEVMGDGRVLVAYETSKILLWDIVTETHEVILSKSRSSVSTMAAVPDGRVALGYFNGCVKLLDVHTKSFHYLGRHSGEVTSLVVLSNGNFASTALDGHVRVWDPRTAVQLMIHVLTEPLIGMVLVPGGYLVAYTDSDELVFHEKCMVPEQTLCPCRRSKNPGVLLVDSAQSQAVNTAVWRFKSQKSDDPCFRRYHFADLPANKSAFVCAYNNLVVDGDEIKWFPNVRLLVATKSGQLIVGGNGVQVVRPQPSRASVFLALTAAGVPSTYILEIMNTV